MSIIHVNPDGQLNVDVKNRQFTTIRSAQAWHSSPAFSWIILGILTFIDVFGFYQIASVTMTDNPLVRIVIVAGFTASFEFAPLYIGCSIALKTYDLGKKVHNLVFWLSIAAFALGFLINAVYRFLTMDIAYYELDITGEKHTMAIAFPLSLLLSILPLITSLINMVVGILSYDPVLFDIIKIEKRIAVLNEKKRRIDAAIKELQDSSIKANREENAVAQRDRAMEELYYVQMRLKNFIKINLVPGDSQTTG